ncbi:hypothetical protein NN3_13010 [Nocardia neocaledoniensis NBRC 108232]|nr:hypothetical protein NN3_13010 [Nocardia neocaledoniensis NBRC 108232]
MSGRQLLGARDLRQARVEQLGRQLGQPWHGAADEWRVEIEWTSGRHGQIVTVNEDDAKFP